MTGSLPFELNQPKGLGSARWWPHFRCASDFPGRLLKRVEAAGRSPTGSVQ